MCRGVQVASPGAQVHCSDGLRNEEPGFWNSFWQKKTEGTVSFRQKTRSLRLDNAFLAKPKGGSPLGYQTNAESLKAVFVGLEM